ncbi:MAG: class I SAM-dependent methyltransferase [Sedimentisphaerales bacterium]|nr:class I SAM-dependent methyltransferase [Sedimentisphaerales bacterium]
MLEAHNLFRKGYLRFFGGFRLPVLIGREIEKDWTILDVGCGRQSPLKYVSKGSYRVGLDMYEPYIAESRRQKIHDEYVVGDARSLPFDARSFDCVIATDVLEHLSKADGLKMIGEMERVARRKIILTTPNGFLPTYAGPKDNPEEEHLCGWSREHLTELGFKVYGFNGLKQLWTIRKGRAVTKIRLPILSTVLIDLSQFFLICCCSSLAFHFFLVKELSNNTSSIKAIDTEGV